MKIGLYLQNSNIDNRGFNADLKAAKNADISLLVFPENCTTPFSDEMMNRDITDENDFHWLVDKCMRLGKEVGCAIVFSGLEKDGALFSVFANPFACADETDCKLYVKHTATDCSAFNFGSYSDEWIHELFDPIVLNGKKIGLTICYDCNHAAFSRMWGKRGIDILINSTGGNVDYYKWYRYNKVRAIENNCMNFCTMGYVFGCKNSSYTFGFTSSGKLMECSKITKDIDDSLVGIYVYDTSQGTSETECDIRLHQSNTHNKYQNIFIKPNEISNILKQCQKLYDNLYISIEHDLTIVYIVINDIDILSPEKVLKLMYDMKLKEYKNKRYIIFNCWDVIDRTFFENILSDVLRVRAMENYCAIILNSFDINLCYQTSQNRVSQVLALEDDGSFGIDLSRTKGPEVVWKNCPKSWREGYEKLIGII
ncbi:MAG: nitrilase-related carbon-nitrogen hydrolase [Acutalibacteraceae bacterium]